MCCFSKSLHSYQIWCKLVKKWPNDFSFFKIQDGGSRHVEFWLKGLHRYHRCVVRRSRYIPTKFGVNLSKLERTASVFQNSRWRLPPCWLPVTSPFSLNICVFIQSSNTYTKFGENWSNDERTASHIRNSIWRQPPSGIPVAGVFQYNR